MNKLFTKIAALSVGLTLAVGVGVAVNQKGSVRSKAAQETWTLSGGPANGTAVEDYSTGVAGISVNGGQGTHASMPPKWYANGTEIRCYAGNTITFTIASGSLTGITFSYSTNYANFTAADSGTFDGSGGIWAGDAASVTFTNGSSAQARFKAVAFTYSSGGSSDTFSVNYLKNDSSSRAASGMPDNVSGLEDGASVTLTGNPTRWGYTFVGWGPSASSTASDVLSSVTIDGADENVYAIWEENHAVAGAWSDLPYTVAQARTAIDDNENLTSVYVAGIISQVDSYNSKYKSITYWISDDGSTTDQFEVYSGKGLSGADFSSVNDVEVGAVVVINGDIKLYNTTYEFNQTSQQISYTAPSTGDITVTFQPSVFLGVGDSGTYTASTEAANPSYSFSSDNSSVLSVASNGAYTAVAAGSATVRVDVTSSEGNGYKEVAVTVVAVKTVSEAYAIAAALDSGATTDYSIKVTGSISSLDADSKARAINVTDGTQVIEIFFGAGNSDYTTVATTGFIGSKVTVFGKVQNYSGTYELKDITLAGVVQGDADSYAIGAYKHLDSACETGVEAVTDDQWTLLSNGFSAIDPSEQAKFKVESPTGVIKNWVDRYTIIVANSSNNDFMSLGISSGRIQLSTTVEDNNMMIIAVIAAVSAVAFAALLIVKKKRHN